MKLVCLRVYARVYVCMIAATDLPLISLLSYFGLFIGNFVTAILLTPNHLQATIVYCIYVIAC